jgi:hypothetical protein
MIDAPRFHLHHNHCVFRAVDLAQMAHEGGKGVLVCIRMTNGWYMQPRGREEKRRCGWCLSTEAYADKQSGQSGRKVAAFWGAGRDPVRRDGGKQLLPGADSHMVNRRWVPVRSCPRFLKDQPGTEFGDSRRSRGKPAGFSGGRDCAAGRAKRCTSHSVSRARRSDAWQRPRALCLGEHHCSPEPVPYFASLTERDPPIVSCCAHCVDRQAD